VKSDHPAGVAGRVFDQHTAVRGRFDRKDAHGLSTLEHMLRWGVAFLTLGLVLAFEGFI
jgi:hypothetical protein